MAARNDDTRFLSVLGDLFCVLPQEIGDCGDLEIVEETILVQPVLLREEPDLIPGLNVHKPGIRRIHIAKTPELPLQSPHLFGGRRRRLGQAVRSRQSREENRRQ
jgi:hypothetical protein